jgi:ubiquinone/menaquinone biosynthesis C-methylase UbiE
MGYFDLQNEVSETVNSLLNGEDHIKLLEAGCGSATHIKFDANVYAVGVDISKEELEKNNIVHEKILGDIQNCALPKDGFDVVICWMVLEHLSKPEDALHNLFRAVKPQGLLILGFPNLLSIKGVVTKITPFWFHNVFYHYMKYTSRHFPTYLRTAIVPKRVIRLAADNGFSVEFCKLVEDPVARRIRNRFWFMDLAFCAVDSVTRLVSFGKLQSPFLDNCGLILKKRSDRC